MIRKWGCYDKNTIGPVSVVASRRFDATSIRPAQDGQISAAPDDVLARSRAMYAALRFTLTPAPLSSSMAPPRDPSRDRHTFTTYFNRAPRHFYLEFRKQGGDRYVIWATLMRSTPGGRHRAQDDYPNPNNLGAFSTADYQTAGSASEDPAAVVLQSATAGAFLALRRSVMDAWRTSAAALLSPGGRGARRVWNHRARSEHPQDDRVDRCRLAPHSQSEGRAKRRASRQSQPHYHHVRVAVNPALDDSRFKFIPPEPK